MDPPVIDSRMTICPPISNVSMTLPRIWQLLTFGVIAQSLSVRPEEFIFHARGYPSDADELGECSLKKRKRR